MSHDPTSDPDAVSRRRWLARAALVLGATILAPHDRLLAAPAPRRGHRDARRMLVHKRVGCRCCDGWVKHLRDAGYDVTATADPHLDVYKDAMGVPKALRSCHTGVSGGYVFEGHVPIDLVGRVLDERPALAGLAVPGMPMGAPGMESEHREPYDVIAFRHDGATSVYASR